jgi:transposase
MHEVVSKRWHNLFLCTKPRLSQAQALLLPKVFVSLGIKFFIMAKLHFRPYIPNQTVLFPGRIDENIAANDPVRIVNTVVDNLNLDNFKKLYKATGRCPYHPKMMLKVIIYAYMNNIYSCRKIEKLLLRDIHYIWLSGNEHPDFITINRFRNRVKEEINNVFTQLVLVLVDKGFISLDVEYIDGTKIESRANKYTFVWRKTVEKNRTKLMDKIRILLEQVDEAIAQENSTKDTPVEFTPAMLSDIVNELKEVLEHQPVTKDKEQKKVIREKKKQVRELEEHRDKLMEYDNHLDTLGERNSYSKTDPDATFMRMKEDAMRNGQTKPGYNLQIGTQNQFLIDFRLFPNPTDTLTLIPFFHSFEQRYNRLPTVGVADSGYGSEENYRFMQDNGIEAFVKYNYFHKEQRPRYTPNPFHAESLHYNAEEDYYVCPMGQHMNRIGTRSDKTASGYITESARYKAQRCEGCPLRGSCFKARGNRIIEVNHRLNQYKRLARERLLSKEGFRHRGRRCIEPEAVFGQMKHNMAYKRFRHVGEDKVTMDFAFFAIAFNIKKMCTKLLKAGKRRSTHIIFIFIRPRVAQHTRNIKPYLITEEIVA